MPGLSGSSGSAFRFPNRCAVLDKEQMPLFFALFILLPALELYLLIAIGAEIGALSTFALILVTGAVGATLVRQQGLGVLGRIRAEAAEGRLPAKELLEGLVLLFAGALLLTPGLLTDGAGFLALIPALRARIGAALAKRVVASGSILVISGFRPGAGGGPTAGPFDPPKPGGAPPFDPRGQPRPVAGEKVVDVDAKVVE